MRSLLIWSGVRVLLSYVKSGSMLYHAIRALLKPLVSPVRSSCSGKSDGVLEMNHDFGSDTSMPFLVFSKSSIYDASSCVPPACPAMSCANSPVNDICEGCVR